jgi:hypothetical protein
MTSVEKTTIPISKAAIIVIFVGGVIANYYTTLNAVKSGIQDVKTETQIQINDLKNEDKIIKQELDQLQVSNNDMKQAIVSYIGTGMKPEEPQVTRQRR